MNKDVMEMLKEMRYGEAEPGRPRFAPDIEAIRLRDALKSYNTEHVFTPGMIVRQKPQAVGYNFSGYNGLAIVVEVLDSPILVESEAGGPHYREMQDMKIGSLDSDADGVFMIYHVDSRRFEPVPE